MTDQQDRPSPAPAAPERMKDPVEVAVAPKGWAPPKGTLRLTILIIVLAVIGVLIILYAWGLPPFTPALQSTDNAYVRGQTTIISPQVSGYVTEVPVHDFEVAKAGQVLLRIDDRIYRQRVEQARASLNTQIANLNNSEQTQRAREATVVSQQANIDNARAQLSRAQADMKRVDELVADGSVSLRERDQTRAALRQAEAALEQARAAIEIARQDVQSVLVGRAGLKAAVEQARAVLELAEIDLSNTVVVAPQAGRLSQIGARLGQYVTSGTQLMFLVPAQLWVIANFKEAQTSHMAPGQPAHFRVDGLDNARLSGHVERLAPAAGSEFAVIVADNATGNFVKVAQRISVRISIDPGQPLAERLRPGMSVQAEVDTSGGKPRER
ncbi:Multidrug resistance efflux pump [Cupriavidus sp. YR651]|uniref:HlyD family secretion protein n=1 Tax=Cupriavidus sp. YR651 TaxID=1855315 RepID=UPI000881AFA4|nr:HlyD family secretion protein [Cupriavidus sp. YR651]SDD75040.1 Multidrug resistance efflux pump [Cupriavidus sp. YR651]